MFLEKNLEFVVEVCETIQNFILLILWEFIKSNAIISPFILLVLEDWQLIDVAIGL
jgi:hypothetical protein